MKYYFYGVITILFLFLIFPKSVLAQSNIINSPYFAVGETMTLIDNVKGDTYIAGGKVLIKGSIDGDLLVAGGDVDIQGKITEDVRVIGGQVSIKGNVGNNVSAVGGVIDIDDTATIGGSLVAAGGNIKVRGKIYNDLDAAGGKIELTNKSSVLGKFQYWSNEEASVSSSVIIKGQTIKHITPANYKVGKENLNQVKSFLAATAITFKIVGFAAIAIFGLIFIKISKKFMAKTASIAIGSFWKSIGIGFAIIFATPIAAIVLLFTVIGAPFAIVSVIIYSLVLYFAKIFAIYALGVKILPKKSPYLAYILATVIFCLVTMIPIVGGLIGFVFLLAGTGSFIISKKECIQEYNK